MAGPGDAVVSRCIWPFCPPPATAVAAVTWPLFFNAGVEFAGAGIVPWMGVLVPIGVGEALVGNLVAVGVLGRGVDGEVAIGVALRGGAWQIEGLMQLGTPPAPTRIKLTF